MGIVYSLYDALVSIKVPDEKAKAVIDALEREMMDKLATRTDLISFRELISKDLELARADSKIFRADVKHQLDTLQTRLTLKLGAIAGAWAFILFALLKWTG